MTPDPFLRAASLATALRIDLRRPAGWISLAAAAWGGRDLAVAPQSLGVAAAVAAGSLLAVAAIGSPPSGVPRGGRDPWATLGLMRVGWPVLGFLVTGRVVAAAFAVATGLLVVGLLRQRTRPAATSLSLAIAGASATAALLTAAVGGGLIAQQLAAVVTGTLMAAGPLLEPSLGPWEWQPAGLTETRRHWPEAGLGLAMGTSLAAMVGCFFLVPGLAWAYAVLAVGWFVCLAVPGLLDADAATAGQRLLRAAAGRPLAPGTVARAIRTCGVLAAILGWPAVVAAVLPAAVGSRVGSPLTALAALAVAMGVVVAATCAAAVAGGRADVPRAVVLSLAALVAAGAAGGEELAKQPGLPHLPHFAARDAMPIGVEPSWASCETPQSTQPSGSSPSPAGLVEIRRGGAR